MPYRLDLTEHARKGLKVIAKGGDRGKMRQVQKALELLETDPGYPSLSTHQMVTHWNCPDRLKGRDDLWLSWCRKGPSAERIAWSYGERDGDTQVLTVEYIGPHLERR